MQNAKSYSINILKDLIQKPITIDRNCIKKYEIVNSTFSEDIILSKIKELLKKFNYEG